jgi:hypothetical protein
LAVEVLQKGGAESKGVNFDSAGSIISSITLILIILTAGFIYYKMRAPPAK